MNPLHGFVPPRIPTRVFAGDDGKPVDYGNRWRTPPEWSYSIERNLERFAPLIAHAEALIDFLTRTYNVALSEDPAHAQDLLFPVEGTRRAVRIAPANPSAAPLTFVFYRNHYLAVLTGLITGALFPVCSCEACDSTAEVEVGLLDEWVAAVVAGRFEETFRWRRHGYRINDPALLASDHDSSSLTLTDKRVRARVRRARTLYRRVGPWQQWDRR